MAVDPHTAKVIAKVVISQITDEEKRQRLIIGIITGIVVLTFIILIPVFAITSTIDKIKSFFGFGDDGTTSDSSYYSLVEMHDTYAPTTVVEDLEYNGTFPMPVQNATVTSEFGTRIHPVTGKQSFHTGIDLAGAWHSNITSVENQVQEKQQEVNTAQQNVNDNQSQVDTAQQNYDDAVQKRDEIDAEING